MSMKIIYNTKQNGIELKFNEKPSQSILKNLHLYKFRWNGQKEVWYIRKDYLSLEGEHYIHHLSNSKLSINQPVKQVKEIKIHKKTLPKGKGYCASDRKGNYCYVIYKGSIRPEQSRTNPKSFVHENINAISSDFYRIIFSVPAKYTIDEARSRIGYKGRSLSSFSKPASDVKLVYVNGNTKYPFLDQIEEI